MRRSPNLDETEGQPGSRRGLRSARREQMRRGKAVEQPALLLLVDDSRPATAKRAGDRYQEPGLFDKPT